MLRGHHGSASVAFGDGNAPSGTRISPRRVSGKRPCESVRECTGAAFHGCAPNSLVADHTAFPSAHGGPFTMPCQVRHERLTLGRIARAAIDDAGCNGLLGRYRIPATARRRAFFASKRRLRRYSESMMATELQQRGPLGHVVKLRPSCMVPTGKPRVTRDEPHDGGCHP